MGIDHDSFVAWAEQKFGDITVNGDEVKVNDPWWHNENGLPDTDQKCWLNTDKCCFNAFKSKRTGNLIAFVMEVEGCDWDEAREICGGEESLYQLEKKVAEFFQQPEKKTTTKPSLSLPSHTYLIDSLPSIPIRKWAINYLQERHISPKGLMCCTSGRYKNRIVIPYYDDNGDLIYFNTRSLSDKEKVRYLGPPQKEFGVGKGDVLYMTSWPPEGSTIFLTEGEFDAMSLAQCGLRAGACGGKALSKRQMDFLSPYRICLSFDADKAGGDIFDISQALFEHGKMMKGNDPRVTFVRPPMQYKDWNNFLIAHGTNIIKLYISRYEEVCSADTLAEVQLKEL